MTGTPESRIPRDIVSSWVSPWYQLAARTRGPAADPLSLRAD
jgi:hypothetical protein